MTQTGLLQEQRAAMAVDERGTALSFSKDLIPEVPHAAQASALSAVSKTRFSPVAWAISTR